MPMKKSKPSARLARPRSLTFFFFLNDTATTKTYTAQYTLSLHDALPIWLNSGVRRTEAESIYAKKERGNMDFSTDRKSTRLNSSHIEHLVCRLLLEKKKKKDIPVEQRDLKPIDIEISDDLEIGVCDSLPV